MPATTTVTFIELRGNARVTGGGSSIDAMSASDIDLDYTDDGQALERVLLGGGGAIAMAATAGSSGRQLFGQTLTLDLAADGALRRAAGSGGGAARSARPGGGAARSIRSEGLDASGESGKGLTHATFTSAMCTPTPKREECVEYREDATTGTAPRVVHARRLVTALVEDAVTDAVFTGLVVFEDRGLQGLRRDGALRSRERFARAAGTRRGRRSARRGRASHHRR